jgi:hypothetical protein
LGEELIFNDLAKYSNRLRQKYDKTGLRYIFLKRCCISQRVMV